MPCNKCKHKKCKKKCKKGGMFEGTPFDTHILKRKKYGAGVPDYRSRGAGFTDKWKGLYPKGWKKGDLRALTGGGLEHAGLVAPTESRPWWHQPQQILKHSSSAVGHIQGGGFDWVNDLMDWAGSHSDKRPALTRLPQYS